MSDENGRGTLPKLAGTMLAKCSYYRCKQNHRVDDCIPPQRRQPRHLRDSNRTGCQPADNDPSRIVDFLCATTCILVPETVVQETRSNQLLDCDQSACPWVSGCTGTLPAKERYTCTKYTVARAMPITHQMRPIFSP
jgi:hypothetical protein